MNSFARRRRTSGLDVHPIVKPIAVVPAPGVVEIGYERRQFEVLADGRIHNYRFCGTCQYHDKDSWGTTCN